MQYNPQYCTIVVRNTDGSGYLRQFKTLAEAKDAYASISASGASVYLYQPPTKSLASFDALEGIPDYNNGTTYGTGDKVKFQGKVYQLINFIGAAGYDPAAYANLWTEITSFSPPSVPPISSTASPVVENGVTRNPFTFNEEENLNPTKMTKVGCEIVQEVEADGYLTFCAIYPKYRYTLQDGTVISEELGEKNTNGCYYPAGFKIKFLSFGESFREIKILNSLDYSGTVYGPYYQVDTYMGSENAYEVADGSGGSVTQVFIGVRKKEGNLYVEHYFQDGDTPYKTSDASFSSGIWIEAGQPIPNGNYLVTYKVTGDERIHSGIWNVSIENADSSPKGKWVFTPQEPDQPPPPPCSILRKVTNPITGSVEDECDPDVVYPFTVEENCEPPVTVDLEGQTITLGTNKKTGMDNGYGDIVWGPCSGMIYVPNGTLIHSTQTLNYYSNGQGGYYSEGGNNCDPQGMILNESTTDILIEIGGTNYTVGYSYERTIADGNCGSGIETGTEYSPNGTLIVSYNGDNYYSNGSGGYYNCQVNGTLISTFNNPALIMITEIQTLTQIGSYPSNTYANGECGSYTTDGEITYYPSGTIIGSGGGYNFFANGVGGYFVEPIVECPPSGELLNTGTEPLTTFINELSQNVTSGNTPAYTYADGSCGTYITYGENSWYGVGTILASDSSYNYIADGIGGYIIQSICPPSGELQSTTSEPVTIYISELNGNYTAGSYDLSTYSDGSCGTYNSNSETYWYANGTILTSDSFNNYFSNGSGGYYSEPITSCDSYGTYISGTENSATTYISELGDNYVVGTSYDNVYADGNCGTYTESGTSWYSYGTLLVNSGGNNYFSDGSGGYYSESDGSGGGGPSCDAYGTYISGSNSDATVYISELGSSYVAGSNYESTYADGNCGTYTESGTSWYSYGTQIVSDGSYYYFSDGNGSYYSQSI